MSDFDVHALDGRIRAQRRKQRSALAQLQRAADDAPKRAYLDSRLWSQDQRELLKGSQTPHAASALAWVDALHDNFRRWPMHYRIASHWQRPLGRHAGARSLRRLRTQLLSAKDAAAQREHAALFAAHAAPLGRATCNWLQQCWRGEETPAHAPLTVAGADGEGAACRWAVELLQRTDDLADQVLVRGWWPGVLAALGRDANDGWPARLTHRWVGQVMGASGMADGLRLHAPAPPAALGALSFARALGDFGVALLVAARPASLPSFAHQHPYGVRRHRRRGLFATLIAQDAFCRIVLGLGAERRQHQLRATAGALLQSLRIDAWRVLVIDAIARQPETALDIAASTSQRLFGEPAPAGLVGVLPILHQPASGAAFVGQLLCVVDQHALVQTYDVDWFRNPAAAEWLRAADAAARPSRSDDPSPQRVLDMLVPQLEARLG